MQESGEKFSFLMQEFPVVFTFFWTWVGACIGSFLNVCVWRVPNGMSLIKPPSHCPKCGHMIPFYENIPVFAWIFLRGKCSSCHDKISIRYPIVELLTALVFLGVWLTSGMGEAEILTLLLNFTLASVLIASAFTDCDWRIVPDGFVLTLAGAALAVIALQSWQNGDWYNGALRLAQGAVAGVILAGLAMLGKGITGKIVLGWGDVKLLTAMALTLEDIRLWLCALIVSCLLALILAPIYRKIKPKMKNRAIPFVPFIAIGTGIVFFLQKPLLAKLGELLVKFHS